uniref:Nuclear receptor domain-containing protein n=1 Tax=Meloidogyne hapla TaxID=6305 RepID=A0A1I8BL57_MELHA
MKRNIIKECKVCGTTENVCFHYGIRTCRACGAFFRRYLENEKECRYKCKCMPKQGLREKNDEKSLAGLAKCKRCRLEKCLLVGMKKLEVGYLRQDICREEIKEENQEIQLHTQIVDISTKDQNQIDILLPIIEAKKRIMHSFNDLDDIFLNGPILFEEIILSNLNIFNLIDNFSPNPSPISFDDLQNWEYLVQKEGLFNSRCLKYFLVDRLLCVGIAKSMPVFGKLDLADQIAHLRHIAYVFTAFTSSYLAWELGSETWTRKDCVMPALGVIKTFEYLRDERQVLFKWSENLFTKSVVHFNRVALTNVEFALLIAIIFTKSSAKGLSSTGKELLYNKSIKYTKVLLRYNQKRLEGLIEGAQRLDECMRLINCSIETEYFLRLMLSQQLEFYPQETNNSFKCSNFFKHFLERSD